MLARRMSQRVLSALVHPPHSSPLVPIALNTRAVHLSAPLFAGHAKWQNVMHIKAKKNTEKSKIFNRLVLKIRAAVQNQGGADPHLNRVFSDVMDECRKANMPNSTIEKAIKRGLERNFQLTRLEILAPEGGLLIIEGEVENRNSFRNQIRLVLKKYVGFGFANEGRALSAFEEKGVVRVRNPQGDNNLDLGKAEEVAIEAEAEEVKVDDEDDTLLLFIGDKLSHSRVRIFIEKNYPDDYVIVEHGAELVPFVKATLTDETFEKVATAIAEVEEVEGVTRVYNNIN